LRAAVVEFHFQNKQAPGTIFNKVKWSAAMMKSTIAPDLLADPKLGRIVRSANDVLIAHVGGAPHPPEAEWKKPEANGDGAAVELDLHYHDVDSATRFSTPELEDTSELRYRVLDIWGKLIVKSYVDNSNSIVQTLREWRKELEDEEEQAEQEVINIQRRLEV
jgi:hypothetical protein